MVKLKDQQTSKKEEVSGKFLGIDAILDEKIQASVQAGDPQAIEKMRTAMEMGININGIAKGLAKFLMTHQSAYVERVRDDEGDFDRAFRRYKNLSLRSGEKQSAAELSVMFDGTVKLVDEIIVLHQQEEKDLREFVQIRRTLDGLLDDEIQTHARNEFDTAKESAVQIMNRTATVMVVLGGVVIAVVVLAWLFISAKVIRPITTLSEGTKKVAAGDFSGALPVGSEDELGELTKHFNTMIADRGRAWQELQASNKELNAFAYVASHDLKEPLRMVTNYTQLLARRYKGKLDADADEFIGYAVDAATRMQTLIDNLLTYSQIGQGDKKFEPTDCEAVFRRALKNLGAAVEESGASVKHDPLPTVMADDTQLDQLFQNLIGNAIKYRGKDAPCVEVKAEPRGSEWVFAVRDNGIGIGIEPRYHNRVFEMFQRLHVREEYSGTGIGLAICKKIVERHGGRIRVESRPGEGSTFYFTLPNRGVPIL